MRIVLVDDHRMFRDGLKALLERQPSMEVVGESDNGAEAVALSEQLKPDVVVMDVTMPQLNGVEATRRILATTPSAKVLGLSMNADRRYVVAMFEAGAAGYLVKNSAADELIQALQSVMRNQTYVSPAVAGVMVDSYLRRTNAPHTEPQAGTPQLTSRERQVLQLIAEGLTSKEMAAQLSVAVPTIETHRRQIMAKLKIHSVAELTKYALREGLTSLEA